jgi:MFS family permease
MLASTATLPAAFRRLAWSNLAAQAAEQIALAAAPLVAVLAFGAGAAATGMLQTAQTLPFLLLSLPAGVLADRCSRRRLMTAAEGLRAASLAAVLVLAAAGALNLQWLAALGFLGAAGTVAYNVAAPSLVPALVPRQSLAAANGRLELARSLAFAGGPALAGALVGGLGAMPAFAAAAALSTAAALMLSGLAEPLRPALPPRHPLRDLCEGAGFVFAHHLLRPVLLTAFVFNIAFFMLQAVYVPYAVHHLGLSAAAVGVTLASYGIGMVAGALAAPMIARRLPLGTVIVIGPICGLAVACLMAATLVLPSAVLAGASFFLIGAGPLIWTISTTTLRQAVTPGAMLGRVSAIITTASFGARPLGAALGAVIGGRYGMTVCLAAISLGFLIQAMVIVSSPVPRLAALPQGAGD